MKTFIALIALARLLFICVVDATNEDQACRDTVFSTQCQKLKTVGRCDDARISQWYCRFTCDNCGNSQCTNKPLGMQDRTISNCQITASSYYDNRYVPWEARLNTDSYGWTPKSQSQAVGSWLQVDLGKVKTVNAIATQGSKYNDEWMTSYSLEMSYSDGLTFYPYKGGMHFKGNSDRNTVVTHKLDPPIPAQFIRVLPKTWNSWPSMRMELYECK